MGRFRLAWGLFAFAATFVAFLVLWLTQPRPERAQPAVQPPIESVVAAEVAARFSVTGTPTVTRLSDVETLVKANPTVYAGAKNGDWLLRYPDSGTLIIYRREEGKIIRAETGLR